MKRPTLIQKCRVFGVQLTLGVVAFSVMQLCAAYPTLAHQPAFVGVGYVAGAFAILGSAVKGIIMLEGEGWEEYIDEPQRCYRCGELAEANALLKRDRDELREALATLRLE